MKIIYSEQQKSHKPRWEWNFGRKVPYPEKSSRIQEILKGLHKQGLGDTIIKSKTFSKAHIYKVHDRGMVNHIKSCEQMPEGEKVHAHIFPYRSYDPHPKTNLKRAGYYCFDVGTQIDRHTYAAAKSAVDVALHGAKLIYDGNQQRVFSLCRPPGHHAARAIYGGYCYFNNVAIAALYLSQMGRIAILDLDFHHGNGTQGVFYQVPNVLVISIHGDPRNHYPYFCGFKGEKGEYLGAGFNRNVPLPDGVDDDAYLHVLERELKRIRAFRPKCLLVSMGFDTFKGDPVGSFTLSSDFYGVIGEVLSQQKFPVQACLEGGYLIDKLAENASNFAVGLNGG